MEKKQLERRWNLGVCRNVEGLGFRVYALVGSRA